MAVAAQAHDNGLWPAHALHGFYSHGSQLLYLALTGTSLPELSALPGRTGAPRGHVVKAASEQVGAEGGSHLDVVRRLETVAPFNRTLPSDRLDAGLLHGEAAAKARLFDGLYGGWTPSSPMKTWPGATCAGLRCADTDPVCGMVVDAGRPIPDASPRSRRVRYSNCSSPPRGAGRESSPRRLAKVPEQPFAPPKWKKASSKRR